MDWRENKENEVQELKKKILFYETILDHIQNGIMITDQKGKIIFFSKTYGEFLGIDPKEAIGKKLLGSSRKFANAHRGEDRKTRDKSNPKN